MTGVGEGGVGSFVRNLERAPPATRSLSLRQSRPSSPVPLPVPLSLSLPPLLSLPLGSETATGTDSGAGGDADEGGALPPTLYSRRRATGACACW